MMSPPTGLDLDGTTSVLGERRPKDPEKKGPSRKPVCFQDQLPESKPNPVDELDLHPAMTTDMINIFRQKGTDYQSWINSPEDTNCQRPCIVSPSTLQMPHLIHPSDDSLQWDAYCNEWVGAPEEIGDPHPLNLPTGLDYHKLFIRKLGVEKDGSLGWNKYHGRVVFVLELIDDHTHTNRLIGSLYRMEEPPAFFSGILALTFKPRQLYLRYLSLPHPNFMRFDVFTDKPNKHGRNWVLIHEGAPFYVQPTVWNRWGPMAWFKWALGRPLPGDDGDKYYPQGYHTHDLGPKYFEGKGYKELEGFKETLRQQRMGQCPFQ